MERNNRLQRWFGTADPSPHESVPAHSPAAPKSELRAIRAAMTLAVAPCTDSHRLRASARIAIAHSVVDLWLLRADIFQYLAQDLGQKAAAQAIMRLAPLFEGMVPAVAAHRKIPDNQAHERHLH
ncbi:MAG: hypothetical protein Q8M51_05920 [Polaromonas sp.]|uniref:hypothetical protein n=1 Tax=Polaromonas sp. TaxID=1869339 RepID=UPI00273221C2|nr:hypothetical protein [Polaromonas sp.]MDP1739767.1 hypothetical protein [Polaromonas sp.]MDP3355383.1 hypothetical protein [Polaromonas sp.]